MFISSEGQGFIDCLEEMSSHGIQIVRYAQIRFVEKALEAFKQTHLVGVKSNLSTFTSVLPVGSQKWMGLHCHQEETKLMTPNIYGEPPPTINIHQAWTKINKDAKSFYTSGSAGLGRVIPLVNLLLSVTILMNSLKTKQIIS